jgi:hypothetical protein
MIPGLDDAKTTEKSARLDDRIGVAAVTYLLFGIKLGPALALSLVLVFAIWIGWRWLCSKYPSTAWAEVKTPIALTLVSGRGQVPR